jgi:hypothetical protein
LKFFFSLAPQLRGERHRQPMAAVLDRRTPMPGIGYG